MTTPSSGAISFANINRELLYSNTAPQNLNSNDVRFLADKNTPNQTISLSQLYSKQLQNISFTSGTRANNASRASHFYPIMTQGYQQDPVVWANTLNSNAGGFQSVMMGSPSTWTDRSNTPRSTNIKPVIIATDRNGTITDYGRISITTDDNTVSINGNGYVYTARSTHANGVLIDEMTPGSVSTFGHEVIAYSPGIGIYTIPNSVPSNGCIFAYSVGNSFTTNSYGTNVANNVVVLVIKLNATNNDVAWSKGIGAVGNSYTRLQRQTVSPAGHWFGTVTFDIAGYRFPPYGVAGSVFFYPNSNNHCLIGFDPSGNELYKRTLPVYLPTSNTYFKRLHGYSNGQVLVEYDNTASSNNAGAKYAYINSSGTKTAEYTLTPTYNTGRGQSSQATYFLYAPQVRAINHNTGDMYLEKYATIDTITSITPPATNNFITRISEIHKANSTFGIQWSKRYFNDKGVTQQPGKAFEYGGGHVNLVPLACDNTYVYCFAKVIVATPNTAPPGGFYSAVSPYQFSSENILALWAANGDIAWQTAYFGQFTTVTVDPTYGGSEFFAIGNGRPGSGAAGFGFDLPRIILTAGSNSAIDIVSAAGSYVGSISQLVTTNGNTSPNHWQSGTMPGLSRRRVGRANGYIRSTTNTFVNVTSFAWGTTAGTSNTIFDMVFPSQYGASPGATTDPYYAYGYLLTEDWLSYSTIERDLGTVYYNSGYTSKLFKQNNTFNIQVSTQVWNTLTTTSTTEITISSNGNFVTNTNVGASKISFFSAASPSEIDNNLASP